MKNKKPVLSIFSTKKKHLISLVLILLTCIILIAINAKQGPTKNQHKNNLIVAHSYLLKTKLALVEYLRLDKNNPDHEILRDQVRSRITSTNISGTTHLQELKNNNVPDILIDETENIYAQQQDIFDKEESEIINHLTDLSNLLREYLLLIEQIQ